MAALRLGHEAASSMCLTVDQENVVADFCLRDWDLVLVPVVPDWADFFSPRIIMQTLQKVRELALLVSGSMLRL